MSEHGGEKNRGASASAAADYPSAIPPPPTNYYYGTFQGVANYHQPPPHSTIDFPQPVPPHYYPHGYQTVAGYAVAEGQVFRVDRLPCCGIGIGWFLFIVGFFLGAIPWYIGAFLLLCVRLDYREKPGLIACTLAALLAALVVTFGVTGATHYSW